MLFEPKSQFPEQIWCIIPDRRGGLLVDVCYRTVNRQIYDSDLNALLHEMMVEIGVRHVLLMGDFNYGDIDWSSPDRESGSEDSRLFLECLDSCFLTQHVTEVTRSGSSTTLDLVITDELDMVQNVSVLGQFSSSDHHILQWAT
jgi:endonuclease/exonuclease/phosphatase family metal-dependent hydrolase